MTNCTKCLPPIYLQPKFLNICFWYIPPSMRSMKEDEKMSHMEKVCAHIKDKMMEDGTIMIGHQPDQYKKRVDFFRLILCNQAITEGDLDFLVDEIGRVGEGLKVEDLK
jgi:hypothetical protein